MTMEDRASAAIENEGSEESRPQTPPWARVLGLVLGFLALLRPPFGTALGIYTLWGLLPDHSGQEYERLSRTTAV